MYFLITGFGDEMEESGLEEAVLVQEEDADEEEETGSSTKARIWNIHFQVSVLASVSLRIKVNQRGDADVVEPTFLPTEPGSLFLCPRILKQALDVLPIQRFEGFCCVSDFPEDQMETEMFGNYSPSKIKAWNSLRRCGFRDSTHISQLNQGYWTLASTMSLGGGGGHGWNQ